MDGTLIDTEPYWMECEYELVAAFGGTWTEADAHAIVGSDLHESGRYIRDVGGVDLPVDEIVNRMIDGVITRVRRTMPWRPGARDLLAKLRAARVPCALVTMSWRRLADAIVSQLPPGSFAATIVGDEVSRGKPHPEPYLAAARALKVSPRDCVVLEDSPRGVKSAKAAGCRVVAIPHIVHVEPQRGVRLADSLADLDVDSLMPARPSRKRPLVLATAAVLLGGAGVGAGLVRKHEPAAPPPIDIPVDAWAPYWALPDAQSTLGTTGGRMLRQVSPFWYSTHDATTITPDGNLSLDATAAFVAAIRAAGAKVVPSISDGMDAGKMAALLADPAARATHVAAIADLAATNGFDGIDIDYEKFAFADPRSSWETTRPLWISFISELGARLHADGRILTVTVPYITDTARTDLSGYWVYDYAGIEPFVDQIRIMAYDYSTDKAGPIAPLGFVEQAIKAAKSAVRDDTKLVLGVPLYGYNWPIATVGTCPPNPEGRTSVTQRTIDELLAKRGATAIHDSTTGESSFTYQLDVTDGAAACTQTREVHFVDAEGTRQRIDLARRERLGGVSLWALGFDSPNTWTTIASLARVPGAATTTSTVAP